MVGNEHEDLTMKKGGGQSQRGVSVACTLFCGQAGLLSDREMLIDEFLVLVLGNGVPVDVDVWWMSLYR